MGGARRNSPVRFGHRNTSMGVKQSSAQNDRGEPKVKPEGNSAPARDSPAWQSPFRERRSSDRVADDQKSGQGSLSALSKMKMLERRRAAMSPGEKPPGNKCGD